MQGKMGHCSRHMEADGILESNIAREEAKTL